VNGQRRRLLLACFASASFAKAASSAKATEGMPEAKEAARLSFPRDCGAHLAYRTEWWYLTGLLDPPAGSREPRLGVQLTFFRIHPPIDPDNPSRFAAHQLVLAHAAIADPRRGALLHEERIARAGFGIASVSEVDTEVEVDHWRLAREAATGVYRGQARGAQFALELTAAPTQPPLPQGEDGYSRKGPAGADGVPASLYYSEPQLALQARIQIDDSGTDQRRLGRGWLDHEWSSTLLPPQASGWDWAGFNLDDGSALTVFRIRRAGAGSGEAAWFAYASLRAPGARVQIFPPAQVRFEPLQSWTSPRTRAAYPVAQRIAIGSRQFETQPLMPDQELDARAASGIVYWEGASDLLEDGRAVGRGYLELTGYAGPVPGDLSG
jgi:predicted secreted hydrolase